MSAVFQAARHIQDLVAQNVGRFKYLCVPEPKDMPALAFQPFCSALVAMPMGGKVMLPAIEFDDQTNFRTSEVGHIRAHGMLAAKLQPIRPLTQ